MADYDDTEAMAYADGELPPDRTAQMARAAEVDATLRARIETFAASRRVLREQFASMLTEPAPEHLLRLIERASATSGVSILNFPSRAGAWPRRRVKIGCWLLAASLVAAVGLGLSLRPEAQLRGAGEIEVALATAALERNPSGSPMTVVGAGGALEVLPLASFRTDDGRYCRDFEFSLIARRTSSKRMLACRDADGSWVPGSPIVAASSPAPGEYVTASGPGHALSRLSEADEAAALASGWRP